MDLNPKEAMRELWGINSLKIPDNTDSDVPAVRELLSINALIEIIRAKQQLEINHKAG